MWWWIGRLSPDTTSIHNLPQMEGPEAVIIVAIQGQQSPKSSGVDRQLWSEIDNTCSPYAGERLFFVPKCVLIINNSPITSRPMEVFLERQP